MFSQYFGESGKAVNEAFAMIESMLDEDEKTMICVFVDEIESLAGRRQYPGNSNEPQDSLRVCIRYINQTCQEWKLMTLQAVNALLVALDRLRRRPNVLVFCTSNLIEAVVRRSVDRAAQEMHIPIDD